jgi:hypothetical protein
MHDAELGYRQGRPLRDIIPPDRRRLKASLLVVFGMIAGATLLASIENVAAQRSASAGESAVVVRSFAVDRSTSTGGSFELAVDGSVKGIVIAECDELGRATTGGLRWGTIAYDPAHGSYGTESSGVHSLGVADEKRLLNDPRGGLVPIPSGPHRFVLHPAAGSIPTTGARLRAWVIASNDVVATSAIVVLPAFSVPIVPPVMPPPRSFDRQAASMSLTAVNVDRCARLPGAVAEGRVEVTFAPNGSVTEATVIAGPKTTSAAGRCVAEQFLRQARVPAFDGTPTHVIKTFDLPGPPSDSARVLREAIEAVGDSAL